MTTTSRLSLLLVLLLPCMNVVAANPAESAAQNRLRVHESGRFLVRGDGAPFFYLGDTAWELFHRLNLDEARRYLDRRAAQGFTVIQAVALAELEGLTTPNANGHVPLVDFDPARPLTRPGPDNDYWDHVDVLIDEANQRGLYLGLLPTWGDKWNQRWGAGPEIFTPENAAAYGEWLGRRYRDRPMIIWIIGGDRNIESAPHRAINEAMALGLRRGSGGNQLITYHPSGGESSSTWFHGAEWLDFNFRQNGHGANYSNYAGTRRDYDRQPVKPVMDGEPLYEDHPIQFNQNEHGYSTAVHVRRALYWNLFSGAFGHTYGNHAVWQMWQPGRSPINGPLMPWYEAIDQPGAGQMRHGRALLESRPFTSRIPDDTLIVPLTVNTVVPGAGRYRLVGTRDADGSYAMVYVPVGRTFSVRTDDLSGEELVVWWFDPRTGEARRVDQRRREPVMTFTPPTPGEELDWVLVLDDARRGYPPPGQHP